MLCFKNFRSLRIALSFMVAVDGQWQPLLADDRQVQGELQAVHLVGHEDAILLQRVQEVIDDWDPRRLVNPFLQRIETLPSRSLASDEGASTAVDSRIALKRTELAQFIADPEAAIFLGKLFFWDMQVGSDFRRIEKHSDSAMVGKFIGTACATCHYRFGADARDTHVTRIPLAAWDKYHTQSQGSAQRTAVESKPLEFGEEVRSYDPLVSAVQQVPFAWLEKEAPFWTIVGSQGVEARKFKGLKCKCDGQIHWTEELWELRKRRTAGLPDDAEMFTSGDVKVRQITARNSPTVINSGFSDRLFHDGRAESTFNGFSPYGDGDQAEVIHRRELDGLKRAIPVRIAIPNAALASQAVGPVLSQVEMSWEGRTWANLATKLLDARPCGFQDVSPADSVAGKWSADWAGPQAKKTYRDLIQRAFRREWWADGEAGSQDVPLVLSKVSKDDATTFGTLMQANFSLYWGLSLLMYQSTLVSDRAPFDSMMLGDPGPVNSRFAEEQARGAFIGVQLDQRQVGIGPISEPKVHTTGASLFQHGFRSFLRNGCVECHNGPLFSEAYSRLPGQETPADERQFGIQYLVERALLPISRSDSVAVKRLEYRQEIDEQIEQRLRQWDAGLKLTAARLVVEFDRLREEAEGDERRLKQNVGEVLRSSSRQANADGVAEEIARLLMKFEHDAVRQYGERWFFTEEERVRLAEVIVSKLGVEVVRLTAEQARVRPPLPIHGSLAARPYQFYDLGYYAMGVSLPRYDRGIGGHFKLFGNPGQGNGPAGSPYNRMAGALASDSEVLDQGPSTDLSDDSWMRSGVPEGDRFADHWFFSRTRRMVMNESPTGFRKPLLHENETAYWGAFKTPTLRNVELTAPYMHNGRFMTLSGVIEFYDRHGDEEGALNVPRDRDANPDMHPKIDSVDLTESDKLALHFFLLCLTDERVRTESGPFDHPAILLVNGYTGTAPELEEQIFAIDATGANHSIRAKQFPHAYEH
ncbi:MAG TPA: hypothetical protein DIT89_15810 [Planctomycetaceae bacterium]|nr:hypothetical protein [Planctomycetaceae bacterium]